MASTAPAAKLSGLARRLVTDRIIDAETAATAQIEARQNKTNLANYLVEQKKIDAKKIAIAAADEFGLPLFDLDCLDHHSHVPKELLDEKLIRQHQALPIQKRGNRLFVAIADPMNMMALDEIKFNTGLPTEPVMSEADKLNKLIEDSL